jgi:hypothetical protein
MCYLLAILGANHIFHVSALRVKIEQNYRVLYMKIDIYFILLYIVYLFLE